MKFMVRMAALTLAVWLILSGCSGGGGDRTTASGNDQVAEEDRFGGTLTVGIGVPIVNDLLDPHRSASPGNSRIQRSLFDSLVVELPNSEYGPWLAKRWDISDDGLTYTFYLRDDVTFTDGTKLDAEAVKFSFDRIRELPNPGLALNYIGSARHPSEIIRPRVRPVIMICGSAHNTGRTRMAF